MKKLFKGLLVAAMALTMTACGGGESGSNEQKLLIGISPDYAPYESLNTDGEMEGFDIDMTKELINIMNENGGNYTYEFKQMSFDTISTSLMAKQIDLGISGFTMHDDWDVLWSSSFSF